jgi:hypothetical protein
VTPSQPALAPSGDVKAWSFLLSIQRNIDAVITIQGGKLKKRDLEVLGRKVRDLIDAWEEDEGQKAVGSGFCLRCPLFSHHTLKIIAIAPASPTSPPYRFCFSRQ